MATANLVNTDEEVLAHLQQAIDNIEDHEKADYLDALRVAPHLVEIESVPLRFLRFTNFNAAAAAYGLVNYWRRRRETFRERAFLPMTLCGNGAMTKEAIDVQKSWLGAHLPDDSQGCHVVCFDPSRRFESSPDARRQCMWFNGEIISRNPRSQAEGFVMLVLMTEFKYDSTSQASMQLFLDSFPVRPKAWHIFNCIPPWKSSCLVRTFVAGLERMFGHFNHSSKNHFYTSQQKAKLVEIIEAHGISKEGLPRALGGSWSYSSAPEYIRKIQEREITLYPDIVSGPSVLVKERKSETASRQEERAVSPDQPLLIWDVLMERALRDEIPSEQKAAYAAAVKHATPDILQEETNFNWFLMAEDFHPIYAARRLCRYWQLRNDIFGSDQYKPMHQTGEGALGRSDIRVLGTGFLTLLPNDAQGCPVLSIDSTLLKNRRSMSDEARDKCLFYMFSLLAENENGRDKGAVIIFRIDDPPFRRIDVRYLARLVYSLPLRIEAFHLVSAGQVSASVEAQITFCNRIYVHDAVPLHALAPDLEEEFDFRKSNLPKYLGGGWNLVKFLQWQELRSRVEFRISLGEAADSLNVSDFPAIKAYEEISLKEKTERRRRSDIIHCRRKRDRVRIQVDLLEADRVQLTSQQERLQDENRRLTAILEKATTLVNDMERQGTYVAVLHPQHTLDVDVAKSISASQEGGGQQVSHFVQRDASLKNNTLRPPQQELETRSAASEPSVASEPSSASFAWSNADVFSAISGLLELGSRPAS